MKAEKVVFRILNGEVIALFPRLAGSYDPSTCLSYMTTGQHSAASVGLGRSCRLATRREYAPLARELRRIGYKLRVCRRAAPADRAERVRQIGGLEPLPLEAAILAKGGAA